MISKAVSCCRDQLFGGFPLHSQSVASQDYVLLMPWNILQVRFIICHTTEQVRGMGLFPVWHHKRICIIASLCKHACKEVCDVKPGIDPYPLLARSCNKWWPDYVTLTACKKPRFGLKRGKKVQCISNRCKDLFQWKKYFGVRCTLSWIKKDILNQVQLSLSHHQWSDPWFIALTLKQTLKQ